MKPKLRFKEFSDEWEEKKLGDIAEITKLAGFEFSKYVVYSDTGNIIALRGLNVKYGRLVLDDIKYIDQSDLTKLSRSKLYIGDIIFTYVGTIGESAIIDMNDKYYLAPNVALIRLNKDNYYFIQQYISCYHFQSTEIKKWLTTTSQPALSMQSIRQFKINLPSLQEQEKIGQFLSLVDKRIEKQEQRIELLKERKKGWMQKIFNQEIRFKDENGNDYPDWQKNEIKNIVTSISTKKYIAQNKLENGYPIYQQGEYPISGYSNQIPFTDYQSVILFGDHTLSLFKPKEPFLLATDGIKIITFEGIDSGFAYFMLEYYMPSSQGYKRHFSILKEVTVSFPSFPEQEKIGAFLSKQDELIEQEEKKLELLKEQKKGLLQQMFV